MSTVEQAAGVVDPPATLPTARCWAERYQAVRRQTEHLCEPLVTEDYVVQSMPDVSPTKWHLAHTSWFFETFILSKFVPGYRAFDPHFVYLFNSYYVAVGDRHCRQNRGLLSRPTVQDVYAYRGHVDDAMGQLLDGADERVLRELSPLLDIGLHHEQQHQELMVTDLKHVFWVNPLRPAYRKGPELAADTRGPGAAKWVAFGEGIHEIGHEGGGFAFDNESPRHRVLLQAFELSSRLVTNGEYRRFMADGGYQRPELWLSLGWATATQEQWQSPLYWLREGEGGEGWVHHTMAGVKPVAEDEPVCHVSYFEADAFARWAGARLPGEGEWEVAAAGVPVEGNFVEGERYHPSPAPPQDGRLSQMYGDVWQWTRSAYLPYPGYAPPPGALGEYNGKFMCNQFVLRGGSCATPRSHIRATYRNFFDPAARWQFSGIRLARDV